MSLIETWRARAARRLAPFAVSPELVSLAAVVVAFAGVVFAKNLFYDADTYWHIAAGNWILDHRAVPAVDPFSYTFKGREWHAHEWLSEVFMAWAFRYGGWAGVAVLMAAAGGLATWIFAQTLARWLWVIPRAAILGLVLASVNTRLFARPHILSLPLAVAWTAGLLIARDRNRRPSFWLLPVMVVWANMHGGYFIGLLMIGPLALEALLAARSWDARRKVVIDWGLFGLLALCAALVTPLGIDGLLFPLQVQGMETLRGIREWLPADFTRVTTLEAALLVSLFFLLSRGTKVPMLRLAMVLAFLHLALAHRRHELLLMTTAPLLLAPAFAGTLQPGRQGDLASGRTRGLWLGRAAALAAVLGIAIPRLSEPIVRRDAVSAPITAMSKVPAELRSQPVFNHYDFGGYLIFKGVPTFIDGRADLYGDEWMRRYFRIMRGEPKAVDDLLAKERPVWMIIRSRDALARAMKDRPGWRTLHADQWAVVLVNVDALALAQGRSTSAPSSTTR